MTTTPAHRTLAEKYVFKSSWEDAPVPDSLVEMVTFLFTEEEAEVLNALSLYPKPAWAIARKMGRPIREIKPVLDSLAERVFILSIAVRGIRLYCFLNMLPGVFEFQMMRVHRDRLDDWGRRFAALFQDCYDEFTDWLKDAVGGRELHFIRAIPIEQSIDMSLGVVAAHASDRFSELLDRNKSFCLVNVCVCRYEKDLIGQSCGRSQHVCSAMGWFADLAIEKGFARRVSKEEFMEAKLLAAEEGLVNMVDNFRDPTMVCSCCGCCCEALRVINKFNAPNLIIQSHFETTVDAEKCKGCKTCEKICPMHAIEVKGKTAVVDYRRCIGCGVCVSKCRNRALSLQARSDYKPPAESVVEFVADRYLEVKGIRNPFLPKITLGLGRLLSKLTPVSYTGPKYRGK